MQVLNEKNEVVFDMTSQLPRILRYDFLFLLETLDNKNGKASTCVFDRGLIQLLKDGIAPRNLPKFIDYDSIISDLEFIEEIIISRQDGLRFSWEWV